MQKPRRLLQKRFPELHGLYVRALHAQTAKRELARNNLAFVGLSAEYRFATPSVPQQNQQYNLQRLMSPGDGYVCPQAPLSGSWFARLTLPKPFVQSMVDWAANLKWGCSVRPAVDDISFVELYLHWACSSGFVMLQKLGPAKSWKKASWISKDVCETQKIDCFHKDVRAWTCVLKQLVRDGAIAWNVQYCRAVRSLAVVGYSPTVAGMSPRPWMSDMSDVLHWLRAKLVAPGRVLHKLDFDLQQPPLQLR